MTAKLAGQTQGNIRIVETDYKDIIKMYRSKFGFNPEKTVHEQLGITVSKNFNHSMRKSKSIKLLKEIVAFPDDKKRWYKFALKSASEFLSKEKTILS